MGYRTLYLTNDMRAKLRKPFGKVFKDDDKELERIISERKGRLITVGDEVSRMFDADIKIFDGRTRRNNLVEVGKHDYKVFNPPATIQKEAFEVIEKILRHDEKVGIFVDGEEDLLAIPVILNCRLGDVVMYGLFGEGVGVVEIDDVILDKIRCILKEFRAEKFNTVVVGGTFDRLHKGHEFLLNMCCCYGLKIVVGLSSIRMAGIKDPRIEDYDVRRDKLEIFLEGIGADHRIYEIDDVYGPAVETGDAIVVTEETIAGAEEINKKRLSLGLDELDVIIIPYIVDEKGKKISSSDIRDKDLTV